MASQITNEFEGLWNSAASKKFDEFFDQYRTKYQVAKKQRRIAAQEKVASFDAYRLQPNSMQVGFINNLEKLVEKGADKGLLISATGTGKTYASAFALRDALGSIG